MRSRQQRQLWQGQLRQGKLRQGSANFLIGVLAYLCLPLGGALMPLTPWANNANTASPESALVAQSVQGLVHSTRFAQNAGAGSTYHLLVLPDERVASAVASPSQEDGLPQQLHHMLQQRGYGDPTPHMLRADLVVVARLGVRPDRPSVEVILAAAADPERNANFDPDAPLSTGVRYVQLEAYDLPQYAEFLRRHTDAAEDVSAQFQSWRTTVESRGELLEFAQVAPTLVQVAAQHIGSQMSKIERFTQPLALQR